ncbi:hypothetical protein Trydic_g19922 [Trypoxylus dichotomus]
MTIVQATQIISQYDSIKKSFNTPSLALQVGSLLKRALNTAYSMEMQLNVGSAKVVALGATRRLVYENWPSEIPVERPRRNLDANDSKLNVISIIEDLIVSRFN